MLAAARLSCRLKYIRVELIDDKAALPLILHNARLPQNTQMMRNVDDFGIQRLGDFTYIFRTAAETLNNLQALAIGHRSQHPGAAVWL